MTSVCGPRNRASLSPVPEREVHAAPPLGVSVDALGIRIDGVPKILRGGSVQWFRIAEETWSDRLDKFKASGFNTVDMYVPWLEIEPREGEFDRAVLDQMCRFLDLVAQKGLKVYFRPGPYICNEYDGGGVPSWMRHRASKRSDKDPWQINMRTATEPWLSLSERYLDVVSRTVAPYLAARGGPIVLYCVENEYSHFQDTFRLDKFFRLNGRAERDFGQTLDTTRYLSVQRDAVSRVAEGPLTTCPGAPKLKGLGTAEDLIPMPNNYVPGQIERNTYRLLEAQRGSKCSTRYGAVPTGVTEGPRTASTMKRVLMVAKAYFAFNAVGMQQTGFRNAVLGTPQQLAEEGLLQSLRHPKINYFSNVLDYHGLITPAGSLREKFHHFRRANLFFESFEPELARLDLPARTWASWYGTSGDRRLSVDHPALGAKEGFRRAHYFHDAGEGLFFVNLVNESGAPQTLAPGSVKLNELRLPRFTSLEIPVERYPGPASELDERKYAFTLVAGLPLVEGLKLAYSTAEILAKRSLGDRELLVVYGSEGQKAELSFDGKIKPGALPEGVELLEARQDGFTLGFVPGGHRQIELETVAGKKLLLWMTTREEAGRIWFLEHEGKDVVLAGPDYAHAESGPEGTALTLSHGIDRALELRALLPAGVALDFGVPAVREGLTTRFAAIAPPARPRLPHDLFATGRIGAADLAEAAPDFDDRDWHTWGGRAEPLERFGIHEGHAWYRGKIELSAADLAQSDRLFIEHASDFVGVYVNGHYLTTVAPMGTEIDSTHQSARYGFGSLRPYLKAGENVLAFRTEIWGHGSFPMPRGRLMLTRAQLPAVGLDAPRGLIGKAKLGDRPIERWSVRAGLGGERRIVGGEAVTDRVAVRPSEIGKGGVVWYEAEFSRSDLPLGPELDLPLALELKGERLKANLYLNGTLFGRWLSDTGWLAQGTWAEPRRSMWSVADPDQFGLPLEKLRPGDAKNTLRLVLEDTSASNAPPGKLERLSLEYLNEELDETRADRAQVPLGAHVHRATLRST